ncbi:hypothetical protein KIPB_017294, partial [Kipferlia bialata]
KYFDADAFNWSLRNTLIFAKPLFEHEAAVNECMASIKSVGVIDTGVCDKACEAGARLLRVAETLAPRQKAALELVRQYTEVPAV